MAKLTTHILDTSTGTPANGVKINLYRKEGQNSVFIKTAETNSDGRCDEALLSGKDFIVGCYELEFAVQAPQSPEAQPSLLPTRLLLRSHCNTVVFGFISPNSVGVVFWFNKKYTNCLYMWNN